MLLSAILLVVTMMLPGVRAQAEDLVIFDQGEPLLFPEGPIRENGVWLVPLRPIAERFGYTFTKVTQDEIILEGGVIGKLQLKPGELEATMNEHVTRTFEASPRFLNGNLFVSLDFIGYLTDIGYTKVPGQRNPVMIELRPGEKDPWHALKKHYWEAVRYDGNTYFINNTGEVMLKTDYVHLPSFEYADLIPVYRNDRSLGYVDRTGKLAVPATHYRIFEFSEGLAVYKDLIPHTEGTYMVKYGYLNRDGTILTVNRSSPVPLMFDRAYSFADGLAKVVKDGKTYYINHAGTMVIPPIEGSLRTRSFAEGLAAVEMAMKIDGEQQSRTGYMNTKGEFVIPATFEYAGDFSDGLASASKDGKFGYIDQVGQWFITPQFDRADAFHEGYARVMTESDNGQVWSLIDKSGEKLALPHHGRLGSHAEGRIAFEQSGLWGYLNTDGEVVIPPRYTHASSFKGGMAAVNLTDEAGEDVTAYIDWSGKVIWKSQ